MRRREFGICGLALLAGCRAREGEVRLALQPPSANNYPSYLAHWLGFYEQEGVHVAISQIAGASKVLEAVIGASADVGGGVYEQAVQMLAEGRDVRCFVSLLRSPNFAIVASPNGGVKRIDDLRQRSIGVSAVGSPDTRNGRLPLANRVADRFFPNRLRLDSSIDARGANSNRSPA